MNVSRSIAIVTGGASGLGRASATRIVAGGGSVVIADLASSPGVEVAKELGNSAVFLPTDVTNEDQVNEALSLAEAEFGGPVNTAVNCAGIGVATRTLGRSGEPHDLAEFIRVVTVNAVGSFNVARLSAARMAAAPTSDPDGLRGVIINTASIAAYDGQIGQVAYAASKGAIVGMTLPMARDLSQTGIRVVTIAPGLFKTPLLAALPDVVQDKLGKSVPCPSRLGDPDEYAALVEHIITNAMINGEVIRIDGGLRMPPK